MLNCLCLWTFFVQFEERLSYLNHGRCQKKKKEQNLLLVSTFSSPPLNVLTENFCITKTLWKFKTTKILNLTF